MSFGTWPVSLLRSQVKYFDFVTSLDEGALDEEVEVVIT